MGGRSPVVQQTDKGLFTTRTEVRCARCAGHPGHVFDEGPRPAGLRYGLNGVALVFLPARTV